MYVIVPAWIYDGFACLRSQPSKSWPPAFSYPQYVNAITNHLGCYRRCFLHWEHCSRVPASNLYLGFRVGQRLVQRMSSLSGFTHSRHSSVNPGDKSIFWSPAGCCATPVIAFVPRDFSFRNEVCFTGWGDKAHAKPQRGGPGFFCRVCPSLSHGFRLFKGAAHSPSATVARLPAIAGITRGHGWRGRATYDFAGRACMRGKGITQHFRGDYWWHLPT